MLDLGWSIEVLGLESKELDILSGRDTCPSPSSWDQITELTRTLYHEPSCVARQAQEGEQSHSQRGKGSIC